LGDVIFVQSITLAQKALKTQVAKQHDSVQISEAVKKKPPGFKDWRF
jgi:hypothetical protein